MIAAPRRKPDNGAMDSPEPITPPKRRRRWRQFSISTLLVMGLVFSAASLWVLASRSAHPVRGVRPQPSRPTDAARREDEGRTGARPPVRPTPDQRAAAALAARLANERCDELWGERPFSPDTYVARFHNGRWHWGEYDPAGVHGYSAEVSFGPSGKRSKVQIYWSTDAEEIPGELEIIED
ncbi:MAG: hypothetical protein WD847_16575 [Pirellulales bacterium]